MKTEELIRALSADRLAPRTSIDRTMALALLAGSALAVLFTVCVGVRANALESLVEWRFVLKFVVTLGLALPAILLLLKLARPLEDSPLPWWLLWFAPATLFVGVIGELMMVPAAAWPQRLIGTNAVYCLTLIPMFSLASLPFVLAALKRGAPARPRLAGGVGGMVCAGIGAALYASHCPDDSPLFVATWYVLAISLVTVLASMVGGRILRW